MKLNIFLRSALVLSCLSLSHTAIASDLANAILQIVSPVAAPGYPGHTSLGEKCSVAVYFDGSGGQSTASVWIYSTDSRGTPHQAEIYVPLKSGNPNINYVVDHSQLDTSNGDLELDGHFDRESAESGSNRIFLKIEIKNGKTFNVTDEFDSENCTID